MQSVWVRACNLFDVQNIAELEIVSGSKAAAKNRQMFIPVVSGHTQAAGFQNRELSRTSRNSNSNLSLIVFLKKRNSGV